MKEAEETVGTSLLFCTGGGDEDGEEYPPMFLDDMLEEGARTALAFASPRRFPGFGGGGGGANRQLFADAAADEKLRCDFWRAFLERLAMM